MLASSFDSRETSAEWLAPALFVVGVCMCLIPGRSGHKIERYQGIACHKVRCE